MKTFFWSRLDELIHNSKMVIDHPRDKPHPNYPRMIFPLDYGYLEGTQAMDGGGIDVWVGTAKKRQLTAIACTVDTLKKDAEIKLIIGGTKAEIAAIERFSNSMYMSAVIVKRPAGS